MKRFIQQIAIILVMFLIFLGFNTTSVGCDISDNLISKERNDVSEILITSHDQGSTFAVNQGDVIVIRLEENLTTGYQWEVGMIDSSMVELLETDYSPSHVAGLGGGGTRTFRFRAKSPGSQQIQLRLRRSWDPVDVAIERFEVNVQVK